MPWTALAVWLAYVTLIVALLAVGYRSSSGERICDTEGWWRTTNGAESDGQLAEILVERYQDLKVSRRMSEDLLIAGVAAPVADPLHFVAGSLELRLRTRPDAAIQQKLQAASSVMAGSTRSWPTTRRA